MKTPRILGITIAILFTIPLLFALSFLSGPQINTGLPVFTDENLVCAWQLSGDTISQNITIYQEGIPLFTQEETGAPLNTSFTVLQGNTTKNEEWICSVRISNGTATQEQNTTITIQNSAPETPVIFDSFDTDIGTAYTVAEDQTYTFNVTASDVDEDTLTYYFKPATQGFCTMIDSSQGIASCTPLEENHNGSNTLNDIVFWVDDDDSLFAKSSSRTISFTVTPVNDAPFAILENQETPVNETLVYDFPLSDEENNTPLNISLETVPSELTSISLTRIDNFTGRLTYDASSFDFNDVNQSGWSITINTTDSLGASTLNSFLLNITPVGRAPEIQSVIPSGPYVLTQGDSIELNITAIDEDADESHLFQDNAGVPNFVTTTTQAFNNITGNTTATINFTATNDEVGNYTVTITVTDKEGLTDETDLEFTVINVNDPPTISEISNYEINTQENTNASNLIAFVNSPFVFRVNGTDPDEPFGDTTIFTDNTTLFDIDNDGIISFTPNSSQVGSYSINITISDNQSESSSRTIELLIDENTIPQFTQTPLPAETCSEGSTCFYNVSTYAFDADLGDFIAQFTLESNIDSFAYNVTTGVVNFTPQQLEIGNYTINVTVRDTRGAINQNTFDLEIIDVPTPPLFTRFNFSDKTIVETFPFNFELQAEDNDILLNDSITFSTNISFLTIGAVSETNNRSSALLSFTPNASQVGNYTINVTANDTTGRQDSRVFSFQILPKTNPPTILAIQPWGNSSAGNTPVESFNLTPQGSETTLVISENSSFLFAHITEDDITPDDELLTNWYYDGELVASTWNYTRNFNFFSSGEHTLELIINDTTLEQANFTWNLNITDINRPPVLLNNLTEPLIINSTENFGNYFTNYLDTQRFYDPDDDPNGDQVLNLNETNTLSFTSQECTVGALSIATIDTSGDDLLITPRNVGTCSIVFTATDTAGVDAVSNSVSITVTTIADSEEEPTVTTSSGGGGGSSSRSSFIPITTEEESPEPLNILAPKLIEVYENNSVVVPFEVKNTWKEELNFIELSANTNASDVELNLNSNIIESLSVNETREFRLIVSNYRIGENFEIEITADVEEPEFSDSALVLLNGLEQTSDGDGAQIKVTFAKDLLNENSECQELNELLNLAQEELNQGNFAEANRYVDAAINGCKYLVSTLSQNTERPGSLSSIITLDEVTLEILLYACLAFIIIITLSFIMYYHYTSRE